MGNKLHIDLGNDDLKSNVPDNATIEELAAGLPSVSGAKKEALRRAPRTQLAFTNIPVPVKQAFEVEAKKHRMGLKDFLYHCMRAGGVDIPNNQELDARRR